MAKIKNILSKIDINIIIILILSLVIMYPFFVSPYIWAHDTYYQYANIFATLETIDFSNFEFFPNKVVPIIANDFGWGTGIFYPLLPQYITCYLYLFGTLIGATSIFTSMKVVHIVVTFLSGLFMYMLGKKVFKNKMSALLVSVIYITFPYYFIDVMVRDAFSECFMFMFVPLIFLGLEHLLDNERKKFYIYFIIGYVGAINSHLITTVYLTIFVIIFLLFNFKRIFNKQIIKDLFISALVILGLCAPFIVPLVAHTLFGNYAVYIDGLMYDADSMKNTTVSLLDYFSTKRPAAWTGEVVTPISIAALILFIVTILILIIKRKKIEAPVTLKYYIILAILSIVIMLPIIPWEHLPSFLCSIQFTWRLNIFLVFFMSLSIGYIILCFKRSVIKYLIIILATGVALFGLYTLKPMVILESYDTSTFDIDKYGISVKQYLPEKTYNNIEYWDERSDKIIVKSGEADIKVLEDETPYLKFKVKTKESTLEIPRVYYLGYDIKIDGEKVNYYENKYGFIEFKLNKSGTVTVQYTGTILNQISTIIFLLTVVISTGYLIYRYRKNKKGEEEQNEKR